MVVLTQVGNVKLIAEQNGKLVTGGRHQWQYAVRSPVLNTEFTASRIQAGDWFAVVKQLELNGYSKAA